MRSIAALLLVGACQVPIEFEIEHEQVKPSSFWAVDTLAVALKLMDCERVDIRVHDGREDPYPRGRNLSDLRARAVVAYLVKSGVPAAHVEGHGYGATQPLVRATEKDAARINRRVEVVVTRCSNLGIP